MKPPIFILRADTELLAYRDPARALSYVESPDVLGGEYLAVFDAEGRRFQLYAESPKEPPKRRWSWFPAIQFVPVELRPLEEHPSGAAELRTLLQNHVTGSDTDDTLERLIELALKQLPSP